MNDTALTQLKVLVERVVRPLRASTAHKSKIRKELLAHVMSVFEDEAKRGDDNTAFEKTAQRFGPPAELTRQLQETVPSWDRLALFLEGLVGYPSRESALRRAVRHAALIGAACVIFLIIAIIAQSDKGQWLTTARAPALFACVSMAFLMFCGTLLAGGWRQALHGPGRRSWLQAGLVAVGAWLLIPLNTFVFTLAFTWNVPDTFWEVAAMLPLALLAPVALALFVHASNPEIRCLQEWASLKID